MTARAASCLSLQQLYSFSGRGQEGLRHIGRPVDNADAYAAWFIVHLNRGDFE